MTARQYGTDTWRPVRGDPFRITMRPAQQDDLADAARLARRLAGRSLRGADAATRQGVARALGSARFRKLLRFALATGDVVRAVARAVGAVIDPLWSAVKQRQLRQASPRRFSTMAQSLSLNDLAALALGGRPPASSGPYRLSRGGQRELFADDDYDDRDPVEELILGNNPLAEVMPADQRRGLDRLVSRHAQHRLSLRAAQQRQGEFRRRQRAHDLCRVETRHDLIHHLGRLAV